MDPVAWSFSSIPLKVYPSLFYRKSEGKAFSKAFSKAWPRAHSLLLSHECLFTFFFAKNVSIFSPEYNRNSVKKLNICDHNNTNNNCKKPNKYDPIKKIFCQTSLSLFLEKNDAEQQRGWILETVSFLGNYHQVQNSSGLFRLYIFDMQLHFSISRQFWGNFVKLAGDCETLTDTFSTENEKI